MVSSVKTLFATHQKKSDFRPEDPGIPHQTEACQKVVTYVDQCRRVLDQSLDGKNLELVLLEFGIRLQRVIYEHIQQFVISEIGWFVLFAFLSFTFSLSCHLYLSSSLSPSRPSCRCNEHNL